MEKLPSEQISCVDIDNSNSSLSMSHLDFEVSEKLSQLHTKLTEDSLEDYFTNFQGIIVQSTDLLLQKASIALFLKFLSEETAKEAKETKEENNPVENLSSYLGDIFSYLRSLINDRRKQTEQQHLNTFVYYESCYVTLSALLKKLNKYEDYRKLYNNSEDDETYSEDMNIAENCYFVLTKYLYSFLQHIQSLNNLLRNKEFFTVLHYCDIKLVDKSGGKLAINTLEYALDVILFCFKISVNPHSDITQNEFKINIDYIGEATGVLFNVIASYLITFFRAYEKTIQMKIANLDYLENYLVLSFLLTNFLTHNKFDNEDTPTDFHTYFPFLNDFLTFFYNLLKTKVSFLTSNLVNMAKDYDSMSLLHLDDCYTPPYYLKLCNEGFKNLLVKQLIASYINDNCYEVTNRNYWISTLR